MRRPDHHPGEALLIDYAAGALDEARALIVATHLALCPRCRADVAEMEALGGALLASVDPEPVAAGSLEALLARLDGPDPLPLPPRRPASPKATPLLPEPLRGYVGDIDGLAWRTPMPGVAVAELPLPGETKPSLYRMKGGVEVPRHTHGGQELTLVLDGGYADQFGRYRRGDVVDVDADVTHAPVADPEGCLCVAVVVGGLRLTGAFGRFLTPFLKR